MSENFTPLLSSVDWNEEWKQVQTARRLADDATYWDARAKSFSDRDAPSPYVQRFLELADIQPGETIFDMGCGTGALSLPLGLAGHHVVAADFSPGMLAVLEDGISHHGLTTVFTKVMSWEDNWSAFGITSDMVDVCVASRSIAVIDLKEALLRLTDVAHRRVCITLATGLSPRTDERVLEAIGLKSALGRDYLYAFNILAECGIKAELSYIKSARHDTFDSVDDAYGMFERMTRNAAAFLSEDDLNKALGRLRPWLKENLIKNENFNCPDNKGVPEKLLRLQEPRTITWAFLAWDK